MFEERGRKNSAYRSVRYSTVRKQSFTADIDRVKQYRLSKRKEGIEQSTFYNTRTLQLKNQTALKTFNPEKIPYLQSFHSMFTSEKQAKQNKAEPSMRCSLRVKFNDIDQNYAKDQTIEFTLLDPFNRPYTYIDRQIKKCEKQLANDQQILRKLRSDLAIFKYNTTCCINTIEEYGKSQLKRLKNLLKKDETYQQQRKMRVRRQITELFQHHDNNIRLRDDVLNRSKGMQRDIFNCQPFQLQVLAEE